MRVMSATLLGLLSMQLLNAQMRTNPVWECSDAKGLTAEQMILQLNLGMNRQDHESAKPRICKRSASHYGNRAVP
jgi:hypothetical protein